MSSSPIASPQIASTPGCWESFTGAVSSAGKSVAAGVASALAAIKDLFARMYAAIAPAFNNMIGWMKANPQAAVGAGLAAAAVSLGALYYCFCREEKTAVSVKTNGGKATAEVTTTPAKGTKAGKL